MSRIEDEQVTAAVRAELASMGGHLLAVYGDRETLPAAALATLGGWMLQEYGEPDVPAYGDAAAQDMIDQAEGGTDDDVHSV